MRATLLLSACLLLAGCGADAVATPPPPPSTVAPTPEASSVPPNGQDLLFAAMMIAHHGQAVRMSQTLLGKAGVPQRVVAVADYIRADQSREITEMNAWRVAWDSPAVSPDDPAAARHGAGHGMMTEQQLAALNATDGPAATRLYLEQMIAHHNGAILMAKAVLKVGRNAYIHNLAKHILNEQGAENDVMAKLLAM
ncbi:DUF305 domain-containing protein [Phytohabitans sp. LJ34]|uniref:DUF305 domain-containing protein n=1 Tax=Phytohabitans sp. LJ34 TaxID=3452217 RepID=UPI003F8AF0AD